MSGTLNSPGVSVTITDESMYNAAGGGTVPFFLIATQSNKTSPTGVGIAPATIPTQAGKLYLATSQRDLIQAFGNPTFYATQGIQLHGYELNEYGLWAAYSYLGISNSAYILRADLDLAQLAPSVTAPAGPPYPGTYWLNLGATSWGVFRANGSSIPGSAWGTPVSVVVALAVDCPTPHSPPIATDYIPKATFGSVGQIAVVPLTASNYLYEKVQIGVSPAQWFQIGSPGWATGYPTVMTGTATSSVLIPDAGPPSLSISVTNLSTQTTTTTTTTAITITGTTIASLVIDINTQLASASVSSIVASQAGNNALVITNTLGGSITITDTGLTLAALGLPYTMINAQAIAVQNGVSVTQNSNATYPDGSIAGSLWVKGNPANQGAQWNVQYYNSTLGQWSILPAPFYAFDSTLQDGNPAKDAWALASILNPATGDVYIGYDINGTGDQQIRRWSGSQWYSLTYEADFIAPSTPPPDGTLWYNANLQVDIMTNGSGAGDNWYGYLHAYPLTDPNGPQISGSAPLLQSDNMTSLVNNDLWIDSSDLENYPSIYRWTIPPAQPNAGAWARIDNTDHTTPFGIVFADARSDSGQYFTGMQNPNLQSLQAATIVTGGSGGTDGIVTLSGTTGVGTMFQVTGTVVGGVLVALNDIVVPGEYLTDPLNLNAEPVIGGFLTGCVLALTMSNTSYQQYSTASLDLGLSDYVDPDAPDPRDYPRGMLLFNTRYSNYNVKQWNASWFSAGGFDANTDFTTVPYYTVGNPQYQFLPLTSPSTWTIASGFDPTNLVAYMGRKAQRAMVVQALAAVVTANQDIRSEVVFFNLMAAPGYPELIPEFITLNTDMKEIAFCVADTPIRLPPTGIAIQNWASNANDVATTGEDGLVSADPYVGIYYPWGLGINIDGSEIMVPPSAMALCTIAYNDQIAYPWYAPAGFNRGLVTNANSVGYIAADGTYVPTILNNGQRDILYINNINPIAYIPNRGLVVFGQKTLSPVTSALDRINVARLCNYIAYNLDLILKPFLFEQNVTAIRATAAATCQRLFSSLVQLNGLYDYAVVCDLSNNTPTTIDQNELWIDCAIQPTKAIEFIFVPVRILTTSASLG